MTRRQDLTLTLTQVMMAAQTGLLLRNKRRSVVKQRREIRPSYDEESGSPDVRKLGLPHGPPSRPWLQTASEAAASASTPNRRFSLRNPIAGVAVADATDAVAEAGARPEADGLGEAAAKAHLTDFEIQETAAPVSLSLLTGQEAHHGRQSRDPLIPSSSHEVIEACQRAEAIEATQSLPIRVSFRLFCESFPLH